MSEIEKRFLDEAEKLLDEKVRYCDDEGYSNIGLYKFVAQQLQLIDELEESISDHQLGAEAVVREAEDVVKKLKQRIEEYKSSWKNIIDEKCAGDEVHCTCVPALKLRIEELEKKLKEDENESV